MTYRIQREETPLAVLPLDEECFPDDHRVTLDGSLWWVVYRGKQPIGYAGLRPCREGHNAGLGFLCRVGVLPRHRGRGLQKRLIRVREAAARALGLRELVTYCVPWNCASINSLVRCGYRFYRPAAKWGGSGSVYLCKRL
jgi:RimJ/RimL family protein N-acetyltransferase